MQKILYLHAGAEMYGADKVLLELIKGLDKDAFETHVILPNNGVLVGAFLSILVLIIVIQSKLLTMLKKMGLPLFTTTPQRFLKEFTSSGS